MIKVIPLILIIFFCINCTILSQINLVSNGGFEDYTSCPNDYSQIDKAIGWHSAGGTPDYFNSCGTYSFGIPVNYAGFQNGHGYGYAGFISTYGVNSTFPGREYIYTELNQTTIPGTKYYLSMKVATAEMWGDYDDFDFWKGSSVLTATHCAGFIPTNKMGMKFTKTGDLHQNPYYTLITNSAHLYSQSIISDTVNWTTITGSFIADSAYTHLLIGNFFDNAHTDTLGKPCSIQSYYFLDDIIVSSDSLALQVRDIKEPFQSDLEISPNPTHNTFRIKASIQKSEMGTFLLSDIFGNIKYRRSEYLIAGDNYFEETLYLPAGIYFLILETLGHARSVRKIVIE